MSTITRESFCDRESWSKTGRFRRPFRLGEERLTPAQWVGLLNKEGPWLPVCCANISDAREILGDVLLNNETITAEQVWDLSALVGRHDALCDVFRGKRDPPDDPNPLLGEGSPWPVIYGICRLILGDAYNAACGIGSEAA